MPKYRYTKATRDAFKLSAERTGGTHPMIPHYYNKRYGKNKNNLEQR